MAVDAAHLRELASLEDERLDTDLLLQAAYWLERDDTTKAYNLVEDVVSNYRLAGQRAPAEVIWAADEIWATVVERYGAVGRPVEQNRIEHNW